MKQYSIKQMNKEKTVRLVRQGPWCVRVGVCLARAVVGCKCKGMVTECEHVACVQGLVCVHSDIARGLYE